MCSPRRARSTVGMLSGAVHSFGSWDRVLFYSAGGRNIPNDPVVPCAHWRIRVVTIRTMLFVSSGAPSMIKGGFTLSPSQVYFAEISLLFSNAGLFTDNSFINSASQNNQ